MLQSSCRRWLPSAVRASAWLALAAISQPGRAADPGELGIAQLGIESWNTETGLAGNWVSDVVETPDGFLWVATSGGLSRFDGRRFHNYTAANEPQLPSNMVKALAVGPDGRVWLGLENGGIRVLEGGRIAADPRFDALPPHPVSALAFDRAGTLWIGTWRGLYRATASGFERVEPDPSGRDAVVRRIVRSPRGGLWVRTATDGLWRVEEGSARRAVDAPGCTGHDFSEEPDGSLWTSCTQELWQRPTPSGDWVRLAVGVESSRHLVDRDGALWFADREGLARSWRGRTETLPTSAGPGDFRVRALFEDSRGDVWVGTFSRGLTRVRRGVVAAVGAHEGLPVEGTTAVLADGDGTLWLGSWRHGLYRWSPDGVLLGHWAAETGLAGAVWALAEDPLRPGHLWVGGDAGLFELGNGKLRRIERHDELDGGVVRLLFAEGERLWVGGVTGGLEELGPAGSRRHDARDGLGLERVHALLVERSGGLLAGGDRGLYRYEGGRWSEVDVGVEGFHTVRALAESADGTLWIASDPLGLVRRSAGFADVYGEREGLPFNQIFSLQADGSGGLWLSGNEGLLRLEVADLEHLEHGDSPLLVFQALGRRDGMRERECNGWGRPASARLAGRGIVYPTLDGIALVDPRRLAISELLPSEIYFDGAWTGSRPLVLGESERLGTDERHLRVRFGAVEFDRPEAVSFRCRLEGTGADWVLTGSSNEVEFAYLPPGKYELRLQARVPGGDWVEAATTLPIEVRPQLLESDAFRLFVLAATAAAALALLLWRTRVERRHAVALGRERSLLREVIDTSPNPIFAKSRDLTYSIANRAAADLYGLQPYEMLERTDADLAQRAGGVEALDALDREVLESGEDRFVPETRLVDAAGTTRWFRVFKRPRLAPSGAVDQIIGTAVDVTDFKVVEEQLRSHEAELEASREELRRLARRLLHAQEEERRRLARELHDDLTQRLAGLAMVVGGLSTAVERGRAQGLEQRLAQLGRELETLAADAQALARDLHPSLLENLGLEEALRSECISFAQRTGLRIRFASSGVPSGIARGTSLGLYRIAQEALHNALEHAQTDEVRVRLAVDGAELILEVEDGGLGFDSNELAASGGLGLASMTERAQLIGATLGIESRPDEGTRITVHVPLAIALRPPSGESGG
ncbi:MAG: PAS domain-containing protein [Acidobacteria bacterium]|nr:PAS domain-containing protein [Acidobacteriota bacterium]